MPDDTMTTSNGAVTAADLDLLDSGATSEPTDVDGITVGHLSVEPTRAKGIVYEPDPEEIAEAFDPGDTEVTNKGARPIHELRKEGLIDEDVDAHLKVMSRGFTQAKQDAAEARKQMAALQQQMDQLKQEREALLAAVETDRKGLIGNEFMARLPELANQEVDESSLYTREGLEKLAEIKAAKMLQQFTEPLKQQAEVWQKEQAKAAEQARKVAFVEANPWVREDPEIRARAAEMIAEGIPLETAAYRASHEVHTRRMQEQATLQAQQRQARRDALKATASGSLLHSGKSVDEMSAEEEFVYWREVEANGGKVPMP